MAKKKDKNGETENKKPPKKPGAKKQKKPASDKVKKKAKVKDKLPPPLELSPEFISKLNEFILLSIQIFSENAVEKHQEYFDFIHENIQIMNPMFFAAGEDFMGVIFKKTEANETIKDLFLERWSIMRTLSEKIYMFVKLQVNLMAHKNPEVDQKEWKEFTVENLPLINEEFIKLSKKVFLHFLDQTIESKQVMESFIEAWDKSTESIMKIKEVSQKN